MIETEDVDIIKKLICNERGISCGRTFAWLRLLVLAAFAFAAGSYWYTYDTIDKKTAHLATAQDIQMILEAIKDLKK